MSVPIRVSSSLITVALMLLAAPFANAAPATALDAERVLDLETFPVPPEATVLGHRRLAKLSYTIKKPTKKVFAIVDRQLTDRGWKQLPDAQTQGEFASADYILDGFIVHQSVIPNGDGAVQVVLSHKGNVPLESVPLPSYAEKLYSFTGVAMFKSPKGVTETADECRAAMIKAGWVPYGGADDTAYYRQNAIQVDLRVVSAPAQGDATMINVTSKLLSLELPWPSFADGLRYSDSMTTIDFDTDQSHQAVADYYRTQLTPNGWRATTKTPVTIKWKQYTIFRNAQQEMITIATHQFEGRNRVHLDHQNASEVAHDELRQKFAAGKKAKYGNKKWISVDVEVPREHELAVLEKWALKIVLGREDAFAVSASVGSSLTAAGWRHVLGKDDLPVIRTARFERADRAIHIIAVNPSKLPSWVGVVGVGGVALRPVVAE